MDTKSLLVVIGILAILHAIIVFLLSGVIPFFLTPTGSSPLMITEVELNSECDESLNDCPQWVEIGNVSDKEIGLDVWYLSATGDATPHTIALRESGCPRTLPAKSFCVIERSNWLRGVGDRLILNGLTTKHFYQVVTPRLKDESSDDRSWQICPTDDRWNFGRATPGQSNRCL